MANNRKRKKMMYDCVCLRCGRRFRSESQYTAFCSDECKSRYSRTDYSGLYWDTGEGRDKMKFSRKLEELKNKGEDYIENQKRDSIEKFARIDIEEIMKENGKYYKGTKERS